jgi:hypothetical protein
MFLLAAEEKRSKEQFVGELTRGNFYGINSLVPNLAENFNVTAVVFTEVIVLETASDEMQVVLREFPDMKKKLVAFAKARHEQIQQSVEKTATMLETKHPTFGKDAGTESEGRQQQGQEAGEKDDSSTEIDRRESLFKHARGSKYSVEKSGVPGALAKTRVVPESEGVHRALSLQEEPGPSPALASSARSSALEVRMAALEEHLEEIRAAQDVQFRALNQKLGAVLDRLKRLG